MNISDADIVSNGKTRTEMSLHQGEARHMWSPPIPVMVAIVRPSSTTLSANQPCAVSRNERAPKADTIAAKPVSPKNMPRISDTICSRLDRRASLMKRNGGLMATLFSSRNR